MLNDWLKNALQTSGMKQVELSQLLSDAVGRSVDPAAIGKMLRGERKIFADELIEIANLCQYPLPNNASGTLDTIAYMDKMFRLENSDANLDTLTAALIASTPIRTGSPETSTPQLRRKIVMALLQAGVDNSPEEIWAAVDLLLKGLHRKTDTEVPTKSILSHATSSRQIARRPK